MFESIVQSLLERHLGRFVKDLGKHDLKIGLLKGTETWPLFFHWQPHTSLSYSCAPLFWLYFPKLYVLVSTQAKQYCATSNCGAMRSTFSTCQSAFARALLVQQLQRFHHHHSKSQRFRTHLFHPSWSFLRILVVTGEIYIDIPFRSLGSEPVVVSIDRVFVVLSTKSSARVETKVDSDEQVAEAIARKIQDLKLHELKTFGQSNQV